MMAQASIIAVDAVRNRETLLNMGAASHCIAALTANVPAKQVASVAVAAAVLLALVQFSLYRLPGRLVKNGWDWDINTLLFGRLGLFISIVAYTGLVDTDICGASEYAIDSAAIPLSVPSELGCRRSTGISG